MIDNIYNLLINKIDESQVCLNEPMSKHTSFKVGGLADIFVKVNNLEELEYILEIVKESKIPLTVIRKWN